jgi:hypothetical protein
MVVMTAERGDGDYEEMRSLRLAIPLPKAAKPPEQGMGRIREWEREGIKAEKIEENQGQRIVIYVRASVSTSVPN